MTRAPLRDRLARVGAAAVLAAVAAPAWASTAGAQDGGCEGVTVVVDSGRGEAAVGCAADPADGIEALTQAGFAVAEVSSFPGAVCRIDDYPEADCGPMPPADASWSYWYADAEGEWVYASGGAMTRDPDDGDVEGWVFGDGSAPPSLTPGEASGAADDGGEAAADDAAGTEGGGSLTWVLAALALAVIAGLVVWRLRRDRRA
ncbi:hypothetical protein [Glycomyces tenuis]|uniref:hypothetical protein n=1 Tax=Glycomyces tenuis TaxID=58116 RepID=UPI0003F911D2|nr:hypothetical protein [Glycomyces tenuis]